MIREATGPRAGEQAEGGTAGAAVTPGPQLSPLARHRRGPVCILPASHGRSLPTSRPSGLTRPAASQPLIP